MAVTRRFYHKTGYNTYQLSMSFSKKSIAKERAEKLRRMGYRARITKEGEKYLVWRSLTLS